MAIEFRVAPGINPKGSGDFYQEYFSFMEQLGIPQEAFLTFILVVLFLLAVFFFRSDSFGSGRR